MDENGNRKGETARGADGTLVEVMPADGPDDSKKTDSKKTEEQQAPESQQERDESADSEQEAKSAKPRRPWLKYAIAAAILLVVVVSLPFLIPWIGTVLNTVSTDDAYVNGHVTFVAPRVAGQVQHVLVDDNMRVKKGDLLVELDKEPYRIQLSIKQAAVTAAETDLKAARAQVRGLIGLARSQRWMLQSAMDQVANQVANLRANVATYESRKASLALAQANYARGKELLPSGGLSKEDFDQRRQAVKVDEAAVKQTLELVYATRASLGLSPQPAPGHELTEVPPGLQQNFSGVRSAWPRWWRRWPRSVCRWPAPMRRRRRSSTNFIGGMKPAAATGRSSLWSPTHQPSSKRRPNCCRPAAMSSRRNSISAIVTL